MMVTMPTISTNERLAVTAGIVGDGTDAENKLRPNGGPNANRPGPCLAPGRFVLACYLMRLNGVEPSRVFPPTRPSTLRVYQFRHSRARAPILDARRKEAFPSLKASARAGSLRTSVRTLQSGLDSNWDSPAADRRTDLDLDLTKRQKEIFDFVRKYADKTGYPPTVREIGKAVGLHSSSTVHAHLANLEKIGLLRRDPSKPRAIELLFEKAKKTVRPGY